MGCATYHQPPKPILETIIIGLALLMQTRHAPGIGVIAKLVSANWSNLEGLLLIARTSSLAKMSKAESNDLKGRITGQTSCRILGM